MEMLFVLVLKLSLILQVQPFSHCFSRSSCHRNPSEFVKYKFLSLRDLGTSYSPLPYRQSKSKLPIMTFMSNNFGSGDHSLEMFHELSRQLLEDAGGQLDSLAFGRKWRTVYPDIDLDVYR